MSDPQPSPQPDAGQQGVIELNTTYFPLLFLMGLFPAKATINGSAVIQQGWGVKTYPMPPGRHQLRVWVPYIIKLGDVTLDVDVYAGQATVIEWKCPWFILMSGTWVQHGMRPIDVNTIPEGPGHGATMPGSPGLAPGTGPVQPVATTGPAEPAAAAAANPAGWHPDPHGQAALRYWDGQQWTEHTSDGQATAG